MNPFQRLTYELRYLGSPPWDTEIIPPELEAFIRENPPGRSLDLGCGTGTSSLALANRGWSVTGVDFVRRAIFLAKKKAHANNLNIDFLPCDVTRLPGSLLTSTYDLVLDIGCFHALSNREKNEYIKQLDHLIAPGGTWLMYGFIKPDGIAGPGITPTNLKGIRLKLTKRQDGMDRKNRPSSWFWFKQD